MRSPSDVLRDLRAMLTVSLVGGSIPCAEVAFGKATKLATLLAEADAALAHEEKRKRAGLPYERGPRHAVGAPPAPVRDEPVAYRARNSLAVGGWNYYDADTPKSSDKEPLYASPQPAPSGWRPISEAPKDGTQVLVTGLDAIEGRYFFVSRYWGTYWLIPSKAVDDCTGQPTHFMPLPPPPQEEK